MSFHFRTPAVAATVLTFAACGAVAAPLSPGGSIFVTGSTAATHPETAASRSADGQTLDFGFPLVVSDLFTGPQEDSHFFALRTDAGATGAVT